MTELLSLMRGTRQSKAHQDNRKEAVSKEVEAEAVEMGGNRSEKMTHAE